MTIFYLIRHGETEWNRDGNRYCGRSDIGLSERGREQVRRAALELEAAKFDCVFASDLRRACLTAEPIAASRRLIVEQDPRITEIDFGLWEGLRYDEITRQYPDAWNAWLETPELARAGATGETAAEVYQRMNDYISEQSRRHPEGRIAVISHSTALRIYLAGMLGMPMRNYRMLSLSNASVSVIEVSENGMLLKQLNGDRADGI